jgi:integrative and conjugative element protein (TIGR02256 family)
LARLWLSTEARDLIMREAKRRRVLETGGPIFGYQDGGRGDVVVQVAYGPGPKARHRPWSLVPDREATQRAIDEVHERNRGSLEYLGEWHTHPGGRRSPSGGDIRSLERLAADEGVELPAPVMMIVPTAVLRRRVRVRPFGAYRFVDGGDPEQLRVAALV